MAWELTADGEQLHAGVWIPGSGNARHVAQGIASSYRRCRINPRPADGRPGCAPGGDQAAAGFVVVPRASMWQPLLADIRSSAARTGTGGTSGWAPDPLDGLWLALAGTSPEYQALVQVLVRPLSRRTRATARRVRRAADDRFGPDLAGLAARGLVSVVAAVVTGLVGAVLDVLTPGPAPSHNGGSPRSHTGGRRTVADPDPLAAQERRVAAAKASAELVEVCLRVVVIGPDRRRCRERAWQAVNALRAAVTGQGADLVRLMRPERRAQARAAGNGRRLRSRSGHRRGWFVVTAAELGALARLPHRPALYRFTIAGAPDLPVPVGIPRLGGPEADGEEVYP